MTRLLRVLVDELDEEALDLLAEKLAPRLSATPAGASSPWLTVQEAAEYLRCKPKRVYELRQRGALVPNPDGSRLLFHRSELDRYLSRKES